MKEGRAGAREEGTGSSAREIQPMAEGVTERRKIFLAQFPVWKIFRLTQNGCCRLGSHDGTASPSCRCDDSHLVPRNTQNKTQVVK